MVRKLKTEDVKEVEPESSDSDRLMEKSRPNQKLGLSTVDEPKVKKPFVMTEARKKAFENARAIKIEMANQKNTL